MVVHAALRARCTVVGDPDGGPGALCSAAALPTLLHGIRRALLYGSGQLVAVHFSLRWASRITGPLVALVGVVLGLWSAAITAAPSLHLLKFDYCHRRALAYYAYCLHQDMIHLTGSDTHFNRLYGLCINMLATGSNVLFILLSCTVILCTVLAIAFAGERLKAFNTSVSHLLAVLCFCVPILHRFGSHTSLLVHILMGTISVFFPPLMNPVI